MALTVAELARRCGGTVRGDQSVLIENVAPLETAMPSDIAYAAMSAYFCHLPKTRAGAVILAPADAHRYDGTALLADNPRLVFTRAVALLRPPAPFVAGVHASAVVDRAADVSKDAHVGPLAIL